MDLFELLKTAAERNASDLFLSTGAPPNVKVQGIAAPLELPALAPGEVKALAYSAMSERQRKDFERDLESNLAIDAHGIGRFRLNQREVGLDTRWCRRWR